VRTTYEVRVGGHLDDHWSGWLGGLTVARNGDGTSTLTASAVDQAELHGLLSGLRDLGAPLLGLQATADAAPTLPRAVETERLTLRPATAADADTTWRYRRLPDVGEWLTGIPEDLDAYRATFGDPARLADTVVVEHEDEVIGDFMLRIDDAWAQAEVAEGARRAQAELGWVLDPAFTGRGYATEAVRELLRVCFEDIGVRRVVANCFLDNVSSVRLMERVGMRRETHAVADSLHRDGRWLDTLVYALLGEEWRESTRSLR
jgi:RimJ/RimL family protein N-acetyltransferase